MRPHLVDVGDEHPWRPPPQAARSRPDRSRGPHRSRPQPDPASVESSASGASDTSRIALIRRDSISYKIPWDRVDISAYMCLGSSSLSGHAGVRMWVSPGHRAQRTKEEVGAVEDMGDRSTGSVGSRGRRVGGESARLPQEGGGSRRSRCPRPAHSPVPRQHDRASSSATVRARSSRASRSSSRRPRSGPTRRT